MFQYLDLDLEGEAPITITHDDCVVEYCRIKHSGAPGLVITGKRPILRYLEIINEGAPESGAEADANYVNVRLNGADGASITALTMRDGSSGIYLTNAPDSVMQGIEGYNMRGPLARGQLVQINNSSGSTLEDFSCINDPDIAWTEDVVNVFASEDVVIRRGYLDGCNSPTGVGLMFEDGSANGLAEDVDMIRMGNGGPLAYEASDGTTFRRMRVKEQIGLDQGRGKPASRGWNETDRRNIAPVTTYISETSGVSYEDCTFWNIPGQASYTGPLTETSEPWQTNFAGGTSGAAVTYEWDESDFVMRERWQNNLEWISG